LLSPLLIPIALNEEVIITGTVVMKIVAALVLITVVLEAALTDATGRGMRLRLLS